MIGEVEGVLEGAVFADRRELHDADVHRGLVKGIGAKGESVVLSGGYIDDEDSGDVITYTGEGGRDPNTGRQVSDQELIGGNRQLADNYREGNPIRVTRGSQLDSPYAPESGYQYGGLYRIEDCWSEIGHDGYLIWRYRLVKLSPGEHIHAQSETNPPAGNQTPQRSSVYTTRVVRSSEVGNYVKRLYGYRCQISGEQLNTPNGPYAEACHIQPVGTPHDGPDVPGNILCLSPNMHVLFDYGAIGIADDLTILGFEGELKLDAEHNLSIEAIQYHREHIYRGGQ